MRLPWIQRRFDYSGLVAGTGVATAGYVIGVAALPWVAGAGGLAAVAAISASFFPGVGLALGTVLGAVLKTGVSALFSGALSVVDGSFKWLRERVQNLQDQRDQNRCLDDLEQAVARLRQDVITRLERDIDPVQIANAVVAARLPEQQMMEERKRLATKLDRERLRETVDTFERLRAQLTEALAQRSLDDE